MKILFIENRHKTFFYEPIARKLLSDGHEIFWMIQNKEFIPGGDYKKHIIPYPKENIQYKRDEKVEELIKIDRQFNHFEKKESSYFYYYNEKIKELLQEIRPKIVFGESTVFHELLMILNCKNQNVLYLNPSSCRYPIGRFSFYKYDTLIPYKGSGKTLQKEKAEVIIEQIIHRTAVPDYMKLIPPSKKIKLNDKIIKIKSYILGEKYNTPNPLLKFKLEKRKKQLISEWDELSRKSSKGGDFTILYPLQMQPEANIDVWGKQYRDQAELIKTIAEILPRGCRLIVKPNPKSKYEISEELISYVAEKDNIEALHHKVKMDDVISQVDMVVTVTGTIAIECALSNKPIITLVKTINNGIKSCVYIDTLNKELANIIKEVKKGNFPKVTKEEKITFINSLNKSSFEGKVSDPLTDASCISEKNIDRMTTAFRYILHAV